MDDNGNNFLVADKLSEADADVFICIFKGHKQHYQKIAYTSETRAIMISEYAILE